MSLHRILLCPFALVAAGCAGVAPEHEASPAHVTSLATSLEPLARWFDDGAGRARFVTLLSPT